jgi:hypothetical protein
MAAIFDPANLRRLLAGEQTVPELYAMRRVRRAVREVRFFLPSKRGLGGSGERRGQKACSMVVAWCKRAAAAGELYAMRRVLRAVRGVRIPEGEAVVIVRVGWVGKAREG